jgi:hypothetical protein
MDRSGYADNPENHPLIAAKNLAHHADQLQGSGVADTIEDTISILAREQHPFFTQDCQMLRDIALRGTHRLDNLLHASLLITHYAQNFQAQRMRYRLQRTCRLLDMLLLIDETCLDSHDP